MSKVIESPVKKWPGKITIADPPTWPQKIAWEESMQAARELNNPVFARLLFTYLPGLLACVERFELAGFPETIDAPEKFPTKPNAAVAELITCLTTEITAVMVEADEIPNA